MKTEHGIVIGLIIGILIGASIGFAIKPCPDTLELERQLSEAQIQISTLQVEKTALHEELDSTKANLTESQIQLAELNQTYLQLSDLNLALERDLNETRTELNEAQAEIIFLREEFNITSMPPPPTIVVSWTKEEFWQELLDMNISNSDVTARRVKQEYHVTTKQEVQEFLDFIGNTEAYQSIPYLEEQAERKGHQVAAREFFLLGKLLEWSEGKLTAGFIMQWYEMPGEWFDFIAHGQRFLGIVVQENNEYVMYMIKAGPVPELVPLRLREVIFVWM